MHKHRVYTTMRWTCLISVSLFACATCAALALVAGGAEQPVWELRPYRVKVLVGVVARPELGGEMPASLSARLAERIVSLQGGAWDVTVAPASAELQQAMTASLAGIAADALPKDSLGGDKVMLLQIDATGHGYRAAAREYDVATALWSPVVSRSAQQLAKLPDVSLAAIFEAFAPLARVSAVRDVKEMAARVGPVAGGNVVLRLRASALKPRDPALAPVKPGTVFRLVTRAVFGDEAARRPTVLPWTFCTVGAVGEEELLGVLDTGLSNPLPARWESAMEVLALGVPFAAAIERLDAEIDGSTVQALVGYDVYLGATNGPILSGRTDRQGAIKLMPSPGILQLLLVKHGDQWLARLPVVPGLEPQLLATIGHDEQRIKVEGLFVGVYDAAVDLAVHREILLDRAKAHIAAQEFDAAEQLLKELRKLPTAQDFIASRAQDLKKGISDDPAAKGRIAAVLADFQNALGSQMDGKAIDELAKQLPSYVPDVSKPVPGADKRAPGGPNPGPNSVRGGPNPGPKPGPGMPKAMPGKPMGK